MSNKWVLSVLLVTASGSAALASPALDSARLEFDRSRGETLGKLGSKISSCKLLVDDAAAAPQGTLLQLERRAVSPLVELIRVTVQAPESSSPVETALIRCELQDKVLRLKPAELRLGPVIKREIRDQVEREELANSPPPQRKHGPLWIVGKDESRQILLPGSASLPGTDPSAVYGCVGASRDEGTLVCGTIGLNLASVPAVQGKLVEFLHDGTRSLLGKIGPSHGNDRSQGIDYLLLLPLNRTPERFRVLGRVWTNSWHRWQVRGEKQDLYGAAPSSNGPPGPGTLNAPVAVDFEIDAGALEIVQGDGEHVSTLPIPGPLPIEARVSDHELVRAIEPELSSSLRARAWELNRSSGTPEQLLP